MNREPDRIVELVTSHSLHVKDLLDALGLAGLPVSKLVIAVSTENLAEVTTLMYVPETRAQAMVEAFKQDLNPTVKSIGIML